MKSAKVYSWGCPIQCLSQACLAKGIPANKFIPSVRFMVTALLSLLKWREDSFSKGFSGLVSTQSNISILVRKQRPRLSLVVSSFEIPDLKQMVTTTQFLVLFYFIFWWGGGWLEIMTIWGRFHLYLDLFQPQKINRRINKDGRTEIREHNLVRETFQVCLLSSFGPWPILPKQ